MARATWKNVILVLTLTCDQAARLMSQAQDKPLAGPERWALSFHLLVCRLCRNYSRHLKFLRALLTGIAAPRMDDTAAPPVLDPQQSRALRDRLAKKIREHLDST